MIHCWECRCNRGAIATSTRAVLNIAPDCPADFYRDGTADGTDVGFFFERWEAGC